MSNQNIGVMIVEDDFLVCEHIKRVLQSSKYRIVGEAYNGEEAVQMAFDLKPDVILMDIKMPKMDGIEATQQINENCPLPIVVLTAYEDPELVDQACQVGVSAFLSKPPKFTEIDSAITIAMARHHDLQEIRLLNTKLKKTIEENKTLNGTLPICCYCGVVRDDTGVEHGKGTWMKMDQYIIEKTRAEVSHGCCPKCYRKEMEKI